MEIFDRDLFSLRQEVEAGSLTRAEVADAFVRRLEAVEPDVNGLVQADFERVVDEAAATDRGTVSEPLQGLPFALKSWPRLGLTNRCSLSAVRFRKPTATPGHSSKRRSPFRSSSVEAAA